MITVRLNDSTTDDTDYRMAMSMEDPGDGDPIALFITVDSEETGVEMSELFIEGPDEIRRFFDEIQVLKADFQALTSTRV